MHNVSQIPPSSAPQKSPQSTTPIVRSIPSHRTPSSNPHSLASSPATSRAVATNHISIRYRFQNKNISKHMSYSNPYRSTQINPWSFEVRSPHFPPIPTSCKSSHSQSTHTWILWHLSHSKTHAQDSSPTVSKQSYSVFLLHNISHKRRCCVPTKFEIFSYPLKRPPRKKLLSVQDYMRILQCPYWRLRIWSNSYRYLYVFHFLLKRKNKIMN